MKTTLNKTDTPQVKVNPRKVGSIIVLRGATSSGKTTICNKILEQNSVLDSSQQLELFLDGTDISIARGERKNSNMLYQFPSLMMQLNFLGLVFTHLFS